MRIATWNVNSLTVRMPRVEEWFAYAEPDVVCMQETKVADSAFPYLAFQSMGYEVAHNGTGRWNGVAIASRVGLDDVLLGFGKVDCPTFDSDDVEPRAVSATCGGVRVTSVYVPNGRGLADPHYEYKLAWLAALRDEIAATSSPDEPVVVCGDFNIAPEDKDCYDPKKFLTDTHTSPRERAALAEICDWGLVDAFRTQHDAERLYSWWDYRAGDFHQGRGLRIDLVLVSTPLADKVTFALIDRNARKGKQPSDHAPVIVDIDV
ncbi:MAG TPA: exodeoxyribonuclease III [Acidimicrobiales bacterium]|nr:exodeoxyribonuclease III [Acidimicrobiales bacterium]